MSELYSINIAAISRAIPRNILQGICRSVGETFGCPAQLSDFSLDLDRAFDHSREQYNSSSLLAQMCERIPSSRAAKWISVVDVDLFVPVLTFVFGEAQLEGSMAVVSTKRLDAAFYGLPPSPEVLYNRIEKEIIHELGHTFGLYHCKQFECVMRSSTYAEELDLKLHTLCHECAALIEPSRQSFSTTKESRVHL